MDGLSTFGDLLRQHRLRAGLTQEELAERAGLSVRGISDLERGLKLRPRKETVALLARALGLSADERLRIEVVRRGISRLSPPQKPTSSTDLAKTAGETPASVNISRFPHPFICPILVGRGREAEQVRRILQATAAGGRGVVFLAGEPGVGKSRLLAEALHTAESTAFARIRVSCHEREQAEHYSLVLQIAQAVGVSTEHILEVAAASRRVRSIEQTLAGRINQYASGRPLLLTVEDLHWSDESSLAVLLGLVDHVPHRLLIATLRPAPLSRGLAAFLAEANRLRLSTEITLRPLNRADVARMIYVTLNLTRSVPGPLLDEVMTATAGNPFLVEEVCRSLLESDATESADEAWRRRPGLALSIPRSLRHAVEARLLAVPPAAARVAELAAVLGQEMDVSLLGRLSDLDEVTLLSALRELRDAQVFSSTEEVPDSSGLAFRHTLTRQAILERLTEPERQALHRRVAHLLESDPTVSPARLAFHWSQAGDPRNASPHALRAAELAAALHAHREAIHHYQLALAGLTDPSWEILIALGDHHAALGERDLAVARYEEARAICLARGDTAREAELELRIGICDARERRRNAALTHLHHAWRVLPPAHVDRWRAGLWLGLQHAAQGDYARALAILEEAREATQKADSITRLRISYEIGGIRSATGDWAELDRVGTQVLREVAGESDEALALRLDAHHAVGSVACWRGAFPLAWDHFRASRVLADRYGQLVDRTTADWNVAGNVLFPLGRWTEARAVMGELEATAPISWVATVSRWYGLWLDGKWEEAADEAVRIWPSYDRDADLEIQVGVVLRIADILLALERDRDVLVLTQDLLDRLMLQAAVGYAARLIPFQAEAMARLRDPRAGSVIADGLSLARRLGASWPEAIILRARALANRHQNDWIQSFADCDAARDIFHKLDMRYEEAQTLRRAGLLRLDRGRRGDRDQAATLLRAARDGFVQVGAHRDVADVDQILSSSGIASRKERSPASGLDRLSIREREVAAAIAEGLTNVQIADRLYIGERTVAHHVSAILNKLGLDSRAQVASFVTRVSATPDPHDYVG